MARARAPGTRAARAGGAGAAARGLAVVNAQAALLREELAALRQDLAQVQSGMAISTSAMLQEANEQLILAAVRAETIASAASAHVDRLAGNSAAAAAMLMRDGDESPADQRHADDLREANQQLLLSALESQAREAAALEAHRRQVGFLAMVAHELRNPLMPLRLAAVMLDGARNDEQAYARHQATITGQVAQMTRLIGDLLDGSRIRAGEFRLQSTQIDILDVLERAVQTCRPAIDARTHSLSCDLPPGPLLLLGDTVRLIQVFGNLLGNAAKYTPPCGEIRLGAEVHGAAVVVTLADNGIGITPEALPHVFDMFVRDAHAVDADDSGLGVGLAVVRELVAAHKGTVVASSPGPGQGSTFVVTLPLDPASRHPI